MKRYLFLAMAFVLALTAFSFSGAAADGHEATVYVVHGIPGADLGLADELPVDVSVDGACVLTGFEFGDIAGPLMLAEGAYDIQVRVGNEENPCTGGLAIDVVDLPLVGGENATIIAHLDTAGAPTASKYVNDMSEIVRNEGRLTVAHTANAPAVDITLEDKRGSQIAKLEAVENNAQAGPFDLRARIYGVEVFPAGSDEFVAAANLGLKPRRLTNVFAVGSLTNGTFTFLIQRISLPTPAPEFGSVSVVHGVPGLTVDVYVNGGLLLPSFAPGTVTPALKLAPGDYSIEIYPAGADPDGSPAIAGTATVTAGLNATAVAHLTEAGDPTLSLFVNDLEDLARGDSRIVVRHVAAVVPVDVALLQNGSEVGVIPGLANPDEAQVDVPAGRYYATIAPAGGDPVVGPVPLMLRKTKVQIVYAIGSLEDGSFDLLIQTFRASGDINYPVSTDIEK